MLEPVDVEEAQTAIGHFEAALSANTDHGQIVRMMVKLAAAFPAAKVSEVEAEARNRIYCELLEDIPHDVLSSAFKQAAQTCRFFPSVAEIRSAAMPELTKRRWTLFCLRRLVDKHHREYEAPIPEDQLCSPEDAKRILDEVGLSMQDSGKAPKPSAEKEARRAAVKARQGKE